MGHIFDIHADKSSPYVIPDKLSTIWVALWVAFRAKSARNGVFKTPNHSLPKLTKPLASCGYNLYMDPADPNNLPPPPGSKPGRYGYVGDNPALVWIVDPWWKRVPWMIVLTALGVLAAFLAVWPAQ